MNPFYAIFVFPLRYLMNFVLSSVTGWTGDVGAAILVLSLIVNTVLLPLYYLAEKWQNKERSIQRVMAPRLAAIKKNHRGEDQYNRMRALYKEYHYHPVQGLRTSFGFLIQVPFFIAAYTLLSHNPLLENASFLFLRNLSEPDALIPFGAVSLNLMPLLMTVLNLFSSLIYARKLSLGERGKLILVAVLFLVLLYRASSGMVFYWTLSNLYSLVKNLIHNPVKIDVEAVLKREKN